MGDAFIGAWRVSEHVYDSEGELVGVVRQLRRLERREGGRIAVLQDCKPDASLATHPMGRFTGHHEFTLSRDGAVRRYHGPAVIGSGLGVGPHAIVGRGLWPVFGHNFTSYGLVPEPRLQLTGGKFFVATQMIANVVGVAVPDDGQTDWPTLEGLRGSPGWPGDLATEWEGTAHVVGPSGQVLGEHRASRRYLGSSRLEERSHPDSGEVLETLSLEPDLGGYRVAGAHGHEPQRGIAKRYGPALELEICRGTDIVVEGLELLDAERGHLATIRRLWRDHTVQGYRVACLRPAHRQE